MAAFTVTESCGCGASITATNGDGWSSAVQNTVAVWRRDHQHHDPPTPTPPPPTVRPRNPLAARAPRTRSRT